MRRMQNGIESDRREKKTTRNSLEHRGHMGHIGHLCENAQRLKTPNESVLSSWKTAWNRTGLGYGWARL